MSNPKHDKQIFLHMIATKAKEKEKKKRIYKFAKVLFTKTINMPTKSTLLTNQRQQRFRCTTESN